MDVQKLIGKNIKKHRLAAKVSQEELASRIEADQAYVSRLEAGQLNPTVTTMHQVAQALGIEIKLLFETGK